MGIINNNQHVENKNTANRKIKYLGSKHTLCVHLKCIIIIDGCRPLSFLFFPGKLQYYWQIVVQTHQVLNTRLFYREEKEREGGRGRWDVRDVTFLSQNN